jgi:hypothetical protein
MITKARDSFNQQFSEQKYQEFLHDLNSTFNYTIPFRVAESPVFISKEFNEKIQKGANEIIDFIVQPTFSHLMQRALPPALAVPHETEHTLFLALDFAICTNEQGELVPQLIELQGFPSLFGYQDFLGNKFREHYNISDQFQFHFGKTSQEYWARLRKAILNGHDPENVVLLEINPLQQNTAIDFLITQKELGIPLVHIGDVIIRGKQLFYPKDGVEVPIKRIYNRVIFDELQQQKNLQTQFHLTEDVDVEWAGHPNWFFKISKYTMPFLKSSAVPACSFLSDFKTIPADLENYVLKPLFSFSGTGVIFHVKREDIDAIPVSERANFMLQRKVKYEPIVQAVDGLVKAELRLLYLWDEGQPRPELITNLARLSRGEMIGVKYNKDKTWVGGSISFFEK